MKKDIGGCKKQHCYRCGKEAVISIDFKPLCLDCMEKYEREHDPNDE